MYIKQAGLADDTPYRSVPLIGYHNLLTTANISTTSEADGFPASNLTNPATHLKWKGGVNTIGDEYILMSTGGAVNYLAIAGHNFGSGAVLVAVEGIEATVIMLHFDRQGASPDIILDENTFGATHAWTASGNAFLDVTQYKFGGSSLKCDGSGDFVSTPNHPNFYWADEDFTIDCWVRVNSLAATMGVYGHSQSASDYHRLTIATNGAITWDMGNANIVFSIASAAGAIVTNTWYHLAVVRSGNVITLYKDGVAQASGTTAVNFPVITSAAFTVGQDGFATYFNGWIDEFRTIGLLARWTANFTPPKSRTTWTMLANVSDDDAQIMLHFTGGSGSTVIEDSNSIGSTHVWTAAGGAAISTASSKFGGSSLFMDGTGDYITTPWSTDFELGSQDFTLDCWFNVQGGTGTFRFLGGQGDNATAANRSITLFLDNTNKLNAFVFQGSTGTSVVSSSTFTTSGWHHVAFVRTGNTLKLFIDGVQEGGNVSFTGAVNSSLLPFGVGVEGSAASLTWFGWIDEFRFTVGTARWTANFTPPTAAASTGSSITDDSPILFRWATTIVAQLRLHVRPGAAVPEAAVIYAGRLLVMERSITIEQPHVPVTFGRRTNIVNGMSETGNFLGRIVLGEYRESKAEFQWFTPDFYRNNIDPFLAAAQERPFFWVWNPDENPGEVGYVWLTNNAEPEVDPATRRVALTLEMRGIA